MLYSRFTITQLDLEADYGFVRQTASSSGALLTQPIGFTISGVAQAYCDEEDSGYGICIPDQATKDRVPEIGEELIGVIALDRNGMAFDPNGNPFLRNWAYADQYDAVMAVVASWPAKPDDSDDADDADDADDYFVDDNPDDDFPDNQDDDDCPHCGSYTCDTWACQQ